METADTAAFPLSTAIVWSPAMAAPRQPVLEACMIGAALLLGLACSSPTRGHLKGTVYLAGCGGSAPIYTPGASPDSTCTSNFVNGAVVVAVPGRVARWSLDNAGRFTVVSPAAGSALSVRANDKGEYGLDLAAGTYMVAAWADKWQKVEANGRGIPITSASDFHEVQIGNQATVTMMITIVFNPP